MGHPVPSNNLNIDRIFCSCHILILKIMYMFILWTVLPLLLLTTEYSLVFNHSVSEYSLNVDCYSGSFHALVFNTRLTFVYAA